MVRKSVARRRLSGVRRMAVGAMAAVLGLGVLVACGGEESNDGKTTITMWVAREQYIPPDVFFETMKAEHPDIEVEVEVQPDDNLFTQLQRMVSAGQDLPDIVQVDSYFAAPMFESGVAADLTEVVERWQEEDPANWAKLSASVPVEVDGKVVGLGTTGTADVLYFRNDWLTEAGFTAPLGSWDEVLDALRAIKKQQGDIVPWAMIGTRGEGVNYLLTQMKASGVPFDGATPDLTSEAGKYVISFYQTLIRDGLATTEALGWGENESRGSWIGGRSAMTLDGIRSSNDLGGAIQDGLGISYPDDWSMMLPPLALHEGEGDSGTHTTATRTFHITSTSKSAYEASLVLRVLNETPVALAAAESGALYLQSDVLADPQFRETYPYLTDAEVDALANGDSFPASSSFFEVVNVLEQMVQDILNNPDEDTDALAEKWQAQLDGIEES